MQDAGIAEVPVTLGEDEYFCTWATTGTTAWTAEIPELVF